MEIVTQQLGEALEVKVKGRLDNYWTEHLRGNLEEVIRGGAHGIRLNLSEISFLSSAGVGLLVKFHTQLKGIGGSFVITSPSERVKQVLDLCRLSTILLAQTTPVATPSVHKTEVRLVSSPAGSFEVMECAPGKPLICERIGDPGLLKGCRFSPADCQMVTYPSATFGFGLGAFGHGFEDAQTRFGEFLAVGGSAAYLPTDGTNVPDFVVSSGKLVPEVNVLYGLRCEGDFGRPSNRNGDGGRVGWTGGRRTPPLPRRGRRSERRSVQISRGPLLALVLHGTAVLAIAGLDLRRGCEFRMCAAGSPASAAGNRSVATGSFSCRGIFLSYPSEGKHRSENYGNHLIRDGNFARRTPPSNRRSRGGRAAAERVRPGRMLDRCGV